MTMRGETTPQPYEVWRIPFVFDDQPDVFKFRPVIIGGIGKGGVELMLLSVKVTSHPPRQGIEGEIPLLDWQAAGLSKPSTARCSKTILVPLSVFVGQRKYGKLSQRDQLVVRAALERADFTQPGFTVEVH
ncbi:hypothetical protein [Sutterella wadsworthensis]|uniref:hypothetical protein n=1 Tax=Sutterella wadsworthensis TaxID=40545 RepID=UPI001F114B84|nr:hypothetical protein [Sutterella wadsworthensis]